MAGVTVGLAGTLAAGAAAQTKPPFQKQHQDWPSLASKVTPRPDHSTGQVFATVGGKGGL